MIETTVQPEMQCPVCEYADVPLRYRLQDRLLATTEERFPLFLCPFCGLLFQDAAPLEDRLDALYPSHYWWRPEGGVGRLEAWYREAVMRRDHLRFLQASCAPASAARLLDIGCGSGLFVHLAQRSGYRASGLDSSRSAVEAGLQSGVRDLRVGSLDDLIATGEQYDIVTLFHVLEHVPEPFGFLRRVRQILRKPGRLIVQVPNRDSFQARLFGSRWYGLDCPRHLSNFTAFSLLYLLGRAGYRVHRVRHFSLRDNAAALVSSLVPPLDPLFRRARRAQRGARPGLTNLVCDSIYGGAVLMAQPLAWLESRCGRGASVMVLATWE